MKNIIKNKLSILIVCSLFVSGFYALLFSPKIADAVTAGNQEVISVSSNGSGSTVQALLKLPDDYNSTSKTYPLLVFLHGAGEAGSSLSSIYTNSSAGGPAYFIAQGTFPTSFTNPANGQTEKMIIVSPQASSWSISSTQLQYVVNSLVSTYRVDTNRIYLTGLSAGGEGIVGYTGHIELESGSTINPTYKPAAIVPMSAAIGTPTQSLVNNTISDNVHAWGFGQESDSHGVSTHLYITGSYGGNSGPAAPGLGSLGRFTEYGGTAHCCWGQFYNPTYKETINGTSMNIYEWMLQYSRGSTPTNQSPTVSLTSPTNGATATAPASFTLSASASDSDGTVSSVAFYNGATLLNTDTTSPYSYTWSSVSAGTYSITAKATDNSGAVTTSSAVSVTVTSSGNTAPTANAGTDQSITLPTSSVTLSGSGSDSDGTISSYAWTYISGPATPTIVSASSASTVVSGLVQGTYTFWLTVTDNSGATNADAVTVTVNAASGGGGSSLKTFYIDLGGNQATTISGWNTLTSSSLGTSITLKDSDNNTTSVTAQVTDAFHSENITGTTSSSVYPSTATSDSFFVGTVSNTTDDTGAVTISGLNNSSSYSFTLYASRVAGDGGNRSSLYTIGAQSVSLNATDNVNNTVTISNVTPTNGSVTITLTHPTSSFGYLGVIQINESSGSTPTNQSPTVSLTSPTNGATATAPASFTLSASASDSDGTVSSVAFYNGATLLNTDTTSPYSYTWSSVSAGTYSITAKATDNSGAVTTSSAVSVTVTSSGNTAPTANAGTDQSITLPTSSVTLSGSGSDSDGTISSYAWSKVSSLAGTIVSPSSASTTISGLVAGTHTFRLTVTDNSGLTATDDVVVTVSAANGSCSTRRIYINPDPGDRGLYSTATSSSTYLPGDTLIMRSSQNPYSYIYFEGLHGNANCPITITNEGGQVSMTSEFKFQDSTYVKVLGTGSADQYGFKIQNPSTRNSFGVTARGKSSDIEVSNVWINNTTIGFSIESDGDCDTTVSSWIMNNIILHDSRIENQTSQGFYIGNTSPYNSATSDDPRPVVCNGVTTYPLPARMGNVKIYNNIVNTTGRPGIQLSVASTGISEIYNNTVSNSGDGTDDAQGVGIFAGGLSNAIVHDNVINTTFTAGIASFGAGVTIKNNTITNSGVSYSGTTSSWAPNIWVSVRKTDPTTPTTLLIRDNTMSGTGSAATNILIERDYESYNPQLHRTYTESGNALCNNLRSNGSAITIKNDSVVSWGTNCSGYTVVNPAPTLSAGTNQTITTTSTTLSGYASDEDGIASYSWTKTLGPASGNITSPSSASTTVTGLVPGMYIFRLTATDTKGASHIDEVQIIVNPIVSSCPAKKVVVIGSSTAYGTGPWPISNSWANKFTDYLKGINSSNTLVNLAVGGTTTYMALPTGTSVPNGYPTPDPAHNISAALALNPNAIIINFPTNDAGSGFTVSEQQANFNAIVGAATAAGVPVWVTTTQPRDGYSVSMVNNLTTMRDWITTTYGAKSIDFWTPFANTDGSILPFYGAGDGIHLGNFSHQILLGKIINENIVETLCGVTIPQVGAPTANAGTDQSITLPTSSVTLSGSGSDSDGTISSYAWSKVSSLAGTITSPSSASTTITGLVAGTHTFRLTVTDNSGLTATDDVVIVVNAPGFTLSAGVDQSITLPTSSVILSASVSGGTTASTYSWSKTSGGTATIASSSTASTTVSGLAQGTYDFQVTVVDIYGRVLSDTVRITVSAAANLSPTSNAGTDQSIQLPTSQVTLSGSGSDSDGTIASYAWSKQSGPAGNTITSPSSASTTVTNLSAGTYVFRLTVTDNQGATGFDDITVTVANANSNNVPTAYAGVDQTIAFPISSTTLVGLGNDTDGTIASYSWARFSGDTSVVITTPSSATTTITNLNKGAYTFRLTVTDNSGASASDDIVITVASQGSVKHAPSVKAGVDLAVTGSTTKLTGEATDEDGDAMTYVWQQVYGPQQATISSPNSLSTDISGLVAGTYTFSLTATDSTSETSSDTLSMTVQDIIPSGGGGGGGGSSGGGGGGGGGTVSSIVPVQTPISDGSTGNAPTKFPLISLPKNTSNPSINIPTSGIRKNNSMTDIKSLQSFLNWILGSKITPLVVDGKWGAKTTIAIRLFQGANGLKSDGSFGKLSAAKAIMLLGGNTTVTSSPNTVTTQTSSSISIPISGVGSVSSSDDIKSLKKFLNQYLGSKITPLVIDGNWGIEVINAIKLFQSANGLKPDGSFGKTSAVKARALLNN